MAQQQQPPLQSGTPQFNLTTSQSPTHQQQPPQQQDGRQDQQQIAQQPNSIPSLTPTPSTFSSSSCFSLFSQQQQAGRRGNTHQNENISMLRHREVWLEQRHISSGLPNRELLRPAAPWRLRDRMRTVNAALILALNIGVDPPDVLKPRPCARLEAWIDPGKQAAQKSLEMIGKALQGQYERWQSKAKYKQCLDPTLEDVRRLLLSQRKAAKDDRVLLHYNGHGVPRPSVNGEIWVFNKNYTQYIPLSIYELQSWIGSPTICVFDCNGAGLILDWYSRFAEQRYREQKDPSCQEYILLGACGDGEQLPLNPEYPADIFTACLTTPIRMALLWFCNHSRLHHAPVEVAETLPGSPNNRKTPLGELNWIFTTITDTIAWNVLPREMFQKLFRQDLLVATLFRNFLLAERIMRSLGCLPVSSPKLPSTFKHPLWEAWDLAVDMCLTQIPRLSADAAEYQPSAFFAEQLTAFEVWLEFGSEEKSPPEQLPIVLQVLLSQTHRLRALVLLSRFLDLGSWAVVQALSVGVFPYVLKLLAGQAPELREVLVFIWTKILAIDKQCQADLLKDNGHNYFVGILSSPSLPSPELRVMSAFILTVIMDGCRQGQEMCLSVNLLPLCLRLLSDGDSMMRRWAVLCIAKLWESMDEAKWMAAQSNAPERLYALLEDPCPEVRAATVYALGTFISSTPRNSNAPNDSRSNLDLNTGLRVFVATTDASPLVRREAVITMSRLVSGHWQWFATVARDAAAEEHLSAAPILVPSPIPPQSPRGGGITSQSLNTTASTITASSSSSSSTTSNLLSTSASNPTQRQRSGIPPPPSSLNASTDSTLSSPGGSIYSFLWKAVTSMASDPSMEVSTLVDKLLRSVNKRILKLSQQQQQQQQHQDNITQQQRHGVSPLSTSSWSPAKLREIPLANNSNVRMRSNAPAPPVNSTTAPLNQTGSLVMGVGIDGQSNNTNVTDEPLALKSDFYEWSCEYWHHPLLNREIEDKTSPEYKALEQRQRNNTFAFNEARESWATWAQNPKRKLAYEVSVLTSDNDSVATTMIFHPFKNILATADERDNIAIWDWFENKKMVKFSNRNPPSTRITSMLYANEYDSTQLVVGSTDGVVRVWRDFTLAGANSPKMSTSWKALPQLASLGKQGSGLLLDWQDTGLLLACGDTNYVRLWDITTEMIVQDIPSNCTHSVTAVSADRSETGGGRLFAIGCGDGSLRVFDTRVSPRAQCVSTLQEHKSYILNVGMLAPNRIVSGSAASEIKIWDGTSSHSSLSIVHEDMSAFAVHSKANLMASGSASQRIRVSTLSGEETNVIRYHEGFLGQRMAPVTTLTMHPYRLLLAAAFTDSWISIYSPNALK